VVLWSLGAVVRESAVAVVVWLACAVSQVFGAVGRMPDAVGWVSGVVGLGAADDWCWLAGFVTV
jgi:hypothetical protein